MSVVELQIPERILGFILGSILRSSYILNLGYPKIVLGPILSLFSKHILADPKIFHVEKILRFA